MEINRKNLHTILFLIVFGVLFYTVVQRVEFAALAGILKPFLLGAGIAFVVNVPMRAVERGLCALFGAAPGGTAKPLPNAKAANGKAAVKGAAKPDAKGPAKPGNVQGHRPNPAGKPSTLLRVVSLLLTLALLLGVVLVVCFMIVPEIARSFQTLGGYLSSFYAELMPYLNELAQLFPDLASLSRSWEGIDWGMTMREVTAFLWDFLWNGGWLDNTFGAAATLVSGVANLVIGLVFAAYLLLMKETLARQLKQLGYAYLPEGRMDSIVKVCRMANETFSHFLSGQCLEALLLGLMFFIVMTIGKFPYALMISVLIAVTALIPLFGAFIGCVVGAFLILIVSPIKAVWFVVIFLVLQQVEGNFIYPRVVGSSVGLPSIWVLAAVTLGASSLGIAGMFLAIPAFSVVYQLLRSSSYQRVREREISPDKLR